jgi:hypothetical protein
MGCFAVCNSHPRPPPSQERSTNKQFRAYAGRTYRTSDNSKIYSVRTIQILQQLLYIRPLFILNPRESSPILLCRRTVAGARIPILTRSTIPSRCDGHHACCSNISDIFTFQKREIRWQFQTAAATSLTVNRLGIVNRAALVADRRPYSPAACPCHEVRRDASKTVNRVLV